MHAPQLLNKSRFLFFLITMKQPVNNASNIHVLGTAADRTVLLRMLRVVFHHIQPARKRKLFAQILGLYTPHAKELDNFWRSK